MTAGIEPEAFRSRRRTSGDVGRRAALICKCQQPVSWQRSDVHIPHQVYPGLSAAKEAPTADIS
jgi:hypothetical protein